MEPPSASTTPEQARFLAERLGFGSFNEQVDGIAAAGWRSWLTAQLDPSRGDPAADGRAGPLMPTAPAAQLYAADGVGLLTGVRWQAGTWLRAVYGERQLFERLVLFWGDHLHVPVGGGAHPAMRVEYDRTVLRWNAFGTFADLLVASAKSPAMLRYLDAADSVALAPNENYARELLELHTVGVGEFSEHDVRQLAVALTGRRVDPQFRFVWDAAAHDPRPVEVLGRSIPARTAATGIGVVDDFLRWLAVHPATAARVSRRLCLAFVGDDPPAAVVDAATAAYIASGGSVPSTLRAIVEHPDFWASSGTKLRRPFEQFASMARALRTNAATDPAVRDALAFSIVPTLVELGHAPGAWPAPDGFPVTETYWLGGSRLLARWQVALRLSSNLLAHLPRNHNALLGGTIPPDGPSLVDHMALRLLSRALGPDEREAALGIVGTDYRVGGLYAQVVAAFNNLNTFLLALPATQRT